MARLTRMVLDMTLEASKTLKPVVSTTWQYAKTELAPPFTVKFFLGPAGRLMENSASKISNKFITKIENVIRNIDLEEARQIKQKEDEAKAEVARKKAEAQKKAEEAQRKEEEKLAKEAKARQVAEAEKKAETDKKVAAEAAKVPKPKKKATQARKKAPKKNRREARKGSGQRTKK